MFRARYDFPVDELPGSSSSGRGSRPVPLRAASGVFSYRRKHLVADEVQPDALWSGAIEEVGPNGFADVCPKFIPSVRLGENVDGETLGAIGAVDILSDFEDQFVHIFDLRIFLDATPFFEITV
jgi:hypothetical protein